MIFSILPLLLLMFHTVNSWDVAINGDYAIVAARCEDIVDDEGAAYVYRRISFNKWDNGTKIRASDPEENNFFGESVDIKGDYAIVSSESKNGYRGAAYIFKRTGLNAWDDVIKIVAPDPMSDDRFGCSVALSEDASHAIVGARLEDDGIYNKNGAAYIFERTGEVFFKVLNRLGDNTWDTGTKILASDIENDAWFGNAVSIYGNYAVVAAKYEMNAGAVYVFEKTGPKIWDSSVTKVQPIDLSTSDNFGISVSIYGDYFIAGSYGDGDLVGAAYIFQRDGSNNWINEKKIVAADAESNDFFGYTVSITQNFAIAGASYEDPLKKGAAYIFKRLPGENEWDTGKKLVDPEGMQDDYFGSSVAIDGEIAIVSSYYTDVGALSAGAVFLYEFTCDDPLYRSNNSSIIECVASCLGTNEFGYFDQDGVRECRLCSDWVNQCLECIGNGDTTCMRCLSNFTLDEDNNECVTQCPSDKFAYTNITENREICVPCNWSVLDCSECYGNENATCVRCSSLYMDEDKNECLSSCSSGLYGYTDSTDENKKKCGNCTEGENGISDCSICSGNEFPTCSFCSINYLDEENNECVTQCPDDQFGYTNASAANSKKCVSCNHGINDCVKCTENENPTCVECNTLILDEDNNECVVNCPVGYYSFVDVNDGNKKKCTDICSSDLFGYTNTSNGDERICVPCSNSIADCSLCTGNESPTCSLCSTLYLSDSNECVSICPGYGYTDISDNNRKKCGACSEGDNGIAGCSECSGNENPTCNLCENDYLDSSNNVCTIQCPDGKYGYTDTTDGNTKKCVLCSEGDDGIGGCDECFGNEIPTCTLCSSNYLDEHRNECVETCSSAGEFGLTISDQKKCVLCSEGVLDCEECLENETPLCTKCFTKYLDNNNECVTECPTGEYGSTDNDLNKKCHFCSSKIDNCLECQQNEAPKCTKCSGYLSGDECKECEFPCKNGGKSNDDCNSCTDCLGFFSGDMCGDCEKIDCDNSGVFDIDKCECICRTGFSGELCQTKDSPSGGENNLAIILVATLVPILTITLCLVLILFVAGTVFGICISQKLAKKGNDSVDKELKETLDTKEVVLEVIVQNENEEETVFNTGDGKNDVKVEKEEKNERKNEKKVIQEDDPVKFESSKVEIEIEKKEQKVEEEI